MPVSIETERLIISEFDENDAPFIQKLVNSDGWLRFIGDRGVRNIDDAKTYLRNGPIKSYTENGFGLWRVALKHSQIPVGMCGLLKRDTMADIDIGFAMLPEFFKKGYTSEAAIATLEFAKNTLKLKRVVAITKPDNVASIGLLQKLGFVNEGIIAFNSEDTVLLGFNFE